MDTNVLTVYSKIILAKYLNDFQTFVFHKKTDFFIFRLNLWQTLIINQQSMANNLRKLGR